MHNHTVLFTGDIFTNVFLPISKPHWSYQYIHLQYTFDKKKIYFLTKNWQTFSSLQWQVCVQQLLVRMAVCVRVQTEVTLAHAQPDTLASHVKLVTIYSISLKPLSLTIKKINVP